MKKKLILCLFLLVVLLAISCEKKVYFNEYISECKYNVLTGQEGDFSINVNLTKKENPYTVNGICGEVRNIIEIFLYTPDNTLVYNIFFEESGKTLGGEMNYNSAKSRQELSFEYYNNEVQSIEFALQYNDTSLIITALSVIETTILTPENALNSLYLSNKEVFTNMTATGTFVGEIHIRLVFESDKCYYYIGVVNKTGKIFAYLLNAEDGTIIAQKEINYRTQLSN